MSTVIRVEKSREYVVMNNRFLRNKEMSLKAKGLLALCLSLPDDWDYSINGLVSITKESITAVRNAMKELEELGYMKINKLQNEKGHFHYEYVIYETPHIENLHLDNADMENLVVDSSNMDNQLQQSIEKQIIKEKVFNKEGDPNIYRVEFSFYALTGRVYLRYIYFKGGAYNLITDKEILSFIEKFNSHIKVNVSNKKNFSDKSFVDSYPLNLFTPNGIYPIKKSK